MIRKETTMSKKRLTEIMDNFYHESGGVGPMTVAELMKNIVQAWRKN